MGPVCYPDGSLQVDMNVADTLNFNSGRFISWVKTLGVCLALSFLLSGCATSSPEDDYVAAVLAEAMQDYGAVGQMPPVEAGTPPAQAVSMKPSSVPVPSAQVTSVPSGGTVSIVQPPVVVVPTAVLAPLAPIPVAVPIAPVSVVAPAHTQEVPASVVSEVAVMPPSASGPVTAEGITEPVPSGMDSIVPAKTMMPKPSVATIQPDSIVWVSVTEDPSLSGRYMVNDASAIDFGYVGLVFLPDLSVEQAEAEIKRVLEGRYLKNATVSVKLAKASYDRVSVHGNVEMPGEIKIGPGATISLNEALRRAGGLHASRDNSRVKIIRGGAKTPFGAAAEGDVYPLMTQDGQLKVPDIFLRNDDLVYVFTPSSDMKGQSPDSVITGVGGKRVILLGEVPRRGVIEFSENEPCTLMYLLFKIGGLPRFARGDKILVVRRDKDGHEKKFTINGEKLMKTGQPEDDLVLETGDRIVVPARSISFL